MLAAKDSRIVHISDTARVVVSFVSADDYFLHIRRRVFDVQRDLEALHAAGLLDAMPAVSTLPRVETVYEATRGDSGSLEGVPVQALAAAAVDLDIAPDGRPVAGEYHQVAGVRVSAPALDAAVDADEDVAKRAWYDAPDFVILAPIPTRWVGVKVVVPAEVAAEDGYEWKYLNRAGDIVRALFPDAEVEVRSVRVRDPEAAPALRFMRERATWLLQSPRARTVKIGCTTVRAVRLDDEAVATIRDGFERLGYGSYRGIEYAQAVLGDGVYYIARRGGRWYVAKKVE